MFAELNRNRRVSSSLSPIFYLFLAPASILNIKVQALLAHDEAHNVSLPPIVSKQRTPNMVLPLNSGR